MRMKREAMGPWLADEDDQQGGGQTTIGSKIDGTRDEEVVVPEPKD